MATMHITARVVTNRISTGTLVIALFDDGVKIGTARADAVDDGDWQLDGDSFGPAEARLADEYLDTPMTDISDELREAAHDAIERHMGASV